MTKNGAPGLINQEFIYSLENLLIYTPFRVIISSTNQVRLADWDTGHAKQK